MSSTKQTRFSLQLLAPLLALTCCLPVAPAQAQSSFMLAMMQKYPMRIAGTPAPAVMAGSAYRFTPTLLQQWSAVTFSISNKPAWALFNIVNGTLSGTPSQNQQGSYGNIVISVSDGRNTVALPAFTLTVNADPALQLTALTASNSAAVFNSAPVISGSPAATVVAQATYSFKPTASDANNDVLQFAVTGKPGWASFNANTGELTGRPGTMQTGTVGPIVISVSDGNSVTRLAPFSISVLASAPAEQAAPVVVAKVQAEPAPAPKANVAALTWTPPTQNNDGSPLDNLASYRLYYGTTAGQLTKVITIDKGQTAYTVSDLQPATYYFALSAVNSAGLESALSDVRSKSIQ